MIRPQDKEEGLALNMRRWTTLTWTLAVAVFGCEGPAAAPAQPPAPPGMIYVPGGQTHIGSMDGLENEQPVFAATVEPFFLDVHPVTVAQFREFVVATGHVTQAESFGNSAVFGFETGQWSLVDGADWQHPFGPEHAAAPDDHPVTQVSWNDAVAYCQWADKRLPTEVEWEHAARGARDGGPRYAWGDELVVDGQYMANTWQGRFPEVNTLADGYRATSPVGLFGRTSLGLTDMGGNVWEWVEDWYRPYSERGTSFTPTDASEKVHRGGSFLCDPAVCHGFRVSGRMSSTAETGLSHTGFRCARDIP